MKNVSKFGYFQNLFNEIKGSLVGNGYDIKFYDNFGKNRLNINGDKILVSGNLREEASYDVNGQITNFYNLSSVITLTVDGKDLQSSGDTILFIGKGIEPIINFSIESIESNSESLKDITSLNFLINAYKNFIGKKRVVIIKSQFGVPICAFEGDDIFWEISKGLPKMTKLMIDGKPLYIHRANFQIIDASFIKE